MSGQFDGYFVISNNGGDTSVHFHTKDQLQEALDQEDWGDNVQFLDEMPTNADTNYWGGDNSLMIIKGSIIVPKAVSRVTEYEI